MPRKRTIAHRIVYSFASLSFLLCTVAAKAQMPLFDTSSFAPGIEGEKSRSGNLPLKPDASTDVAAEKPDLETIKSRIVSFNLLVKNARNQDEKAQFLLARCLLHLQRAQYIIALPADEKSPVEEQEMREAYASAFQDTNLALKEKKVSVNTRAYAYYLQGLSQLGLNKRKEAIRSLEKSLKTSTKTTYAGSIILFIGDLHYEKEDYLKTVLFLNQNLPRLKESQKILAQYKVALAYAEMKENTMAEETLMTLMKRPHLGEMGSTIVKELAIVAARNRNEAGLISLASQVFPLDAEKRTEFLSSAYANLQRQQPKGNHGALFQSLMNLAAAPEKRVRLWLDEIRNSRQNYASRRPLGNFQSISLEFGRLKEAESQAVLTTLGEALNLECDFLIRSYVDTFTGKTANKEKLSNFELTSSLQSFFKFSERYFPLAKNRQQMFAMWMAVCSEQNDQVCVRNVANKALTEGKLKVIHAQAKEAKILALKSLQAKDRGTYLPELKTALEEYVLNTSAPKWIEFSGYLADVYILEKKYDQAIDLLSRAHSIEKSENSFFRLQSARFLAGLYREVVKEKSPGGAPPSPRLAALVREASLKLAAEAGDNDKNFGEYEANINRFLSLNSDETKNKAVLEDYLQRLIEKNEIQKAYLKTKDMDARTRRSLHPTLQKLSLRLMQEGYFAQARQILDNGDSPVHPNLLNESLFARIGAGEPVSPRDLVSLGATERTYLLGVLSLTRPQLVVQFMSLGVTLSKSERAVGVLAAKISQNSENPVLGHLARNTASVQKSESSSVAAFNKIASQISIPNGETGSEGSKKLAKAVSGVRKLRAQVSGALSGQPPSTQVEILQTAIRYEEHIATAIEKSPVPPNLAGEQKLRYLQKLNTLAGEFRDQSKELRKILAGIDGSGEISMDAADSKNSLPLINLTLWPWPQNAIQAPLVRMVQEGNRAGALLMLDLNRAAKSVPDVEYYLLRTGVLLAGVNNKPLANFVQKELKSQGQSEVLRTWRDL